MEIIIIMVVAVYALAIAMQLKGYMASVKVPKAETDKAALEASYMTAPKSA
jgi:hypothetical protein